MKVGIIEENIPIPPFISGRPPGKSVYEFHKLKPGGSRLITVEKEKGETYQKINARVRGAMTAFHKKHPGFRLAMRREKDAQRKPLDALRVWRIDEGKYGE